MHATRKILVGGAILIFILTGIVFFCLDYYMSIQTETDIRRIAAVHLEGMMNDELNRFDAFKDIFFRRTQGLIEILNKANVNITFYRKFMNSDGPKSGHHKFGPIRA